MDGLLQYFHGPQGLLLLALLWPLKAGLGYAGWRYWRLRRAARVTIRTDRDNGRT